MMVTQVINPLYMGNPLIGPALLQTEYPDEMPQNACLNALPHRDTF